MKGSCLCHAVTLTIHNPAPVLDLGLEVCHCTDCRQHCGATGAFLTVKNDNFAIEGADHLKKYAGTSDAGNELVWFWCDGCGGKVYQTSEGFGGEVSVSAGLFPPGSLPAPTREIWMRSAETWSVAYPGARMSHMGG